MPSDKDIARGYSIDLKRVVLAYLAEVVIVIASLCGAVLFAQQYGHHDFNTMAMMMLAPIAFAVVEFCRVPLAISIRTQSSFILKFVAIIGVLAAGCVTIKSMSQLGEIMFRPRLYDVVRAQEKLKDAQSAVASITRKINDADAVVKQRATELDSANQQLKLSTEKLGNLPEQKCLPISGVSRTGHRWTSMKCSADGRITPLVVGVKDATSTRNATSNLLDTARAARDSIDRTATDQTLRGAELNYREAVMNSQLHSFAAMIFWINPTDVTDRQIHVILFFFVFVGATAAAFSATLVALTAVHRITPPVPPVEIADEGAHYILGPYAGAIIREATETAQIAAQEAIRAHRPAPPMPAKV